MSIALLLLPRLAYGEMRQVPLGDLTSLARLSFRVSRGSCEARPGPDGRSLRVRCPEPRGELEGQARRLLRKSAVKVRVEPRPGGVELELVVPTPFGGYRFEQKGRTVTIDVGERSRRGELERFGRDLRLPVADAGDVEPLIRIDERFAEGDLAAARAALSEGSFGSRPEVYQLRRADLAWLEGDSELARQSYDGTAGRYRRRSAGNLAQVRLAELEFLLGLPRRRRDLTSLTPLADPPQRAGVLAWLGAARLALWAGDFGQAYRLARALEGVPAAPPIAERARSLRDQALAAMVQTPARASNHLRVAEVALTHRAALAAHPDLEVLAPLAYRALMHLELPARAASPVQARVAASDSDQVVLELAPELARAYLRAGQVYRASQVVDFALAVSPPRDPQLPVLRELQARIALAGGRGAEAAEAVASLAEVEPALARRVAESALFHGHAEPAAELSDRLARAGVPRGSRGGFELLRAEAHLLAGTPEAEPLVERALARARPSTRTARIAYWRARRHERSGEPVGARRMYQAIRGDPRWEELARIAGESLELSARVAGTAAPAEERSPERGERRRSEP